MASETQQQSPVKVRLPHPYLTTYHLPPSPKKVNGNSTYFLRQEKPSGSESPLPHPFHDENFLFSQLKPAEADNIPDTDNTEWARARRSPVWSINWESTAAPSISQAWLFFYAHFTVNHEVETFRLQLNGPGAKDLRKALLLSAVAIEHPRPVDESTQFDNKASEILVLRSAFWQGCASPLGNKPIWLPTWNSENTVPHLEYTIDATATTYLRHPRRTPKPEPGSLMYSRYIPSLDEHFSLMAVDYTNPEHLNLFHKWQNDPRVAKGWLESGTLEHHRGYLRGLHEDPHVVTVFGAFNDVPFAYFEIYWAKEDRMGAHYAALDFDRGRHSLVGEDAFRGTHRVMAWWPSVMHYILLDDHRTEHVVGEPRLTGEKVLMYEYMFGLHQDQWIDLPHKRSNLVKCSRERYFQICPLNQHAKHIAGTTFGFQGYKAKL